MNKNFIAVCIIPCLFILISQLVICDASWAIFTPIGDPEPATTPGGGRR
jgi:hypothetical protein